MATSCIGASTPTTAALARLGAVLAAAQRLSEDIEDEVTAGGFALVTALQSVLADARAQVRDAERAMGDIDAESEGADGTSAEAVSSGFDLTASCHEEAINSLCEISQIRLEGNQPPGSPERHVYILLEQISAVAKQWGEECQALERRAAGDAAGVQS